MDFNNNFSNHPNYPNYNAQYFNPVQYVFPFMDKKTEEKSNLRKLCNKIGMALLLYLGFSVVSGIVLGIILGFFYAIGSFASNFNYNLTTNEMSSIFTYLTSGIISIVSLFIPAAIFCKVSKQPMSDLIGFKKVSVKKYGVFIFTGFTFAMVANFALQFLNYNLSFFGIENAMESDFTTTSVIDCLLFILTVAIIPALVEEILFRGVIMGSLRKYGDGFAILVSALLFGITHGNFVQMPVTFVMGLILGYMTVYTGSILPAMALHFFNNFYSVMSEISISYLGDEVTEIITMASLILIFILGIIFFAVLARKDNSLLSIKKSDSALNLKERLICSLTSPALLVFIIIFMLFSVLILVFI